MILDHLADIEDIQISRRLESIDPSFSIPVPDPEGVRQQQEAKGRESSFPQRQRTTPRGYRNDTRSSGRYRRHPDQQEARFH